MSNDLTIRFSKWYRNFVRDRYQHGEMVPWWKGYVTQSFLRRETIVAPLFLNVLFYGIYSTWCVVSRLPVEFDRFRIEQKKLRSE